MLCKLNGHGADPSCTTRDEYGITFFEARGFERLKSGHADKRDRGGFFETEVLWLRHYI